MTIEKSAFANLALEFVRVTEEAALAAERWVGRGDKIAADQAAVDAMRRAFSSIEFEGEIVIGEGKKDKAPFLYVGEKVGSGAGVACDIAVDPLEGTENTANGDENAITVIAVGPRDSLYRAEESYMRKLAVGAAAKDVIDLDAPVADNIRKIADALGKDVREVVVAVLDRPRHDGLIQEILAAGARVRRFKNGDVAMAIAAVEPETDIDVLYNVGGSTEAVLAAAAIRCLGGEMLCRWEPQEKHLADLRAAGNEKDFGKILRVEDLARGDDLAFVATGVIGGPFLGGAVLAKDRTIMHSKLMTTKPRQVRTIRLERKK